MATLFTASGFAMKASNLRCEYRTNPLGIDAPQPRLSWMLASTRPDERDQRQTAYKLQVASWPKLLVSGEPDLWDSGRIETGQSIGVVYCGKRLTSGQRVYWRVQVWDRDGKSSVSDPAWWEMGLLEARDWQGKWIRRDQPLPQRDEDYYKDDPAPLLRKRFVISGRIRRARAYVSGLGYYELRINGQRVGDHVLDPGWTTYSKRVLYSTYDVTNLVKSGANAVGIMLGNGWYNPLPMRMWGTYNLREHLTTGAPRARLELNIELSDGRRQTVVTDGSWKVSGGSILRNNIYLGEINDARRESPGWDQPGFNDRHWKSATCATEPVGPMRAQSAPPIRVTRTLPAKKITQPASGVFIFDLERNFAGWVRLRVKGEAGTSISLRYGELLNPDGTLNALTSVCGQIKKPGMAGPGAPDVAWQRDVYILKGRGIEVYTPRFTFHGFRYVEVTGLPSSFTPDLGTITGLALNADLEEAGTFACSDPDFNRIQEMVHWTFLSNLFSVQSDCPHRERFGYGGDIVASGEAAILNFDMARFYAKTIQDYADAVRPNGGFTETSPYVGIASDGLGEESCPIEFGTVHPQLQWQLRQYYGDSQILQEQFPYTQKWMQLLEAKAQNHILANGLGDHETLAPKSIPVSGTAFYYYNAQLCAKIAEAIGQAAESRRWADLASEVSDAFNRAFLNRETGSYDSGTQANQAFALFTGLVPPDLRGKAADFLIKDILETNAGHLTTGIFGTRFMLEALTELGRADVAYTLVSQKTFPGWGFMLASGATTLWEHWAFSDDTFSHNHPMFGSVSAWFYKALAGIRPAPDADGFDHIIIKPQVIGDLKWVKGHYHSVRGNIVSEWRKSANGLDLTVVIPVNARATVYVPTRSVNAVSESGSPASQARGVKFLQMEEGCAVFQVGSGEYHFNSRLEP